MPDISLLKELARILDVTVDELLNGEDSLEKNTNADISLSNNDNKTIYV